MAGRKRAKPEKTWQKCKMQRIACYTPAILTVLSLCVTSCFTLHAIVLFQPFLIACPALISCTCVCLLCLLSVDYMKYCFMFTLWLIVVSAFCFLCMYSWFVFLSFLKICARMTLLCPLGLFDPVGLCLLALTLACLTIRKHCVLVNKYHWAVPALCIWVLPYRMSFTQA